METIDAVVACGGRYLADAFKCWKFDGSVWTALPDSSQHHCYYDSVNTIVDEGWWVAGRVGNGSFCSDDWVSDVFNGEEWIPGPQHPTGRSQQSCLVQLNSTQSLYTGGDPTFTASWLFDWSTGVWTQSGDLNVERHEHGCAVLEDQKVLVAGGSNHDNDYVFSVELYDPETGEWTPQPSLPRDIVPGSLALFPWYGSVIALSKNTNHVYQRTMDGNWTAMEGVFLPETFDGYEYDKAVIVPHEFAYGCM